MVLNPLSCNSTYRLRYWNNIIDDLLLIVGKLQQYLPFTVLKLLQVNDDRWLSSWSLQQYLPFTVLKQTAISFIDLLLYCVATVLTVYGIETRLLQHINLTLISLLQQYLPFTVLKHSTNNSSFNLYVQALQQYLPFTVLKQFYF